MAANAKKIERRTFSVEEYIKYIRALQESGQSGEKSASPVFDMALIEMVSHDDSARFMAISKDVLIDILDALKTLMVYYKNDKSVKDGLEVANTGALIGLISSCLESYNAEA